MKITMTREYTLQLTDEEWCLVRLALSRAGNQAQGTISLALAAQAKKLAGQMIEWDSV